MGAVKPIIEVEGLCKDYPVSTGARALLASLSMRRPLLRALDHVSFSLQPGHVVGLVGLNGAGKTTLIKSLCDLLEPSRGRVAIAGYILPQAAARVRAIIGYVPSDERSFFWRLTGRSNLEFFAGLYGLGAREARERTTRLLGEFGLTEKADLRFHNYSSGMRKRLAIVRGLLHSPRILLMDEPTNSLDVKWDRFLRRFVRHWVRSRPDRLVLWSTHRMEEMCDLCDAVIGLRQGRLVYWGDVQGAADGIWMGDRSEADFRSPPGDGPRHCPGDIHPPVAQSRPADSP
ncbi:MAG TPA: ABC transporter ATP-binding protein [Phycisphaerae bacterium]|nr:ABC transporter ATP-binding protein [Phycisphaerae bacterium]